MHIFTGNDFGETNPLLPWRNRCPTFWTGPHGQFYPGDYQWEIDQLHPQLDKKFLSAMELPESERERLYWWFSICRRFFLKKLSHKEVAKAQRVRQVRFLPGHESRESAGHQA